MINAQENQDLTQDRSETTFIAGLRRRVAESPLLALGAAMGAGAIAYSVLRPKPPRGAAAAVASALGRRASPKRTLKAAVGSLALAYLNRRLRSKLRWN